MAKCRNNVCSNKTFYNRIAGGYKNISEVNYLTQWYDSLLIKPSAALYSDLQILYSGLKTDGIIDELDFFYLIGGMETDEQRLRPIITGSGLDVTPYNSPSLTSGGAQGDGISAYLDFNFDLTIHATHYTQNNSSHGCYSRTDNQGLMIEMSGTSLDPFEGQSNNAIACAFGGGDSYLASNGVFYNVNNVPDSLGLYMSRRQNSSEQSAYKNGVLLSTEPWNSVKMGTQSQLGLCANDTGLIAYFSNRQIAFFFYGSGNIDPAKLYSRIQTYMTSRGINV